MDLIYTDASYEDVAVLHDYILDLAIGADENNFELTIDSEKHCCEARAIVYIEGTEYGGVIDGIGVITKSDKLTYKGRTWHGILASKILVPDEGVDYLVVSGEANTVIGELIERIGLSELFACSSASSGILINGYQMHRYVDAYTGITKMLLSVASKLNFTFENGKVILSAAPVIDYSQDDEFDNDQVEMDVDKAFNFVNHLICLGKGELSDRQVVHLYKDAEGNICTEQVLFGVDEIADVYENVNAESLEALLDAGMDKFQASGQRVEMDLDTEEILYDIGDIVGARELITGIFVRERITKKIVTIKNGTINIEYKVGE